MPDEKENHVDIGQIAYSRAEFAEMDAVRFEDQVVRHILARYKVPSSVKKELEQQQRELSSSNLLTVSAFQLFYPNYPVRLACRKLTNIATDSPVYRIFSDFANRKFSRAYADAESSNMDALGKQPIALIFNWPYLRESKALVLHNRESKAPVPGVRIMWRAQDRSRFLCLEPLPVFLAGLDDDFGTGWLDRDG